MAGLALSPIRPKLGLLDVISCLTRKKHSTMAWLCGGSTLTCNEIPGSNPNQADTSSFPNVCFIQCHTLHKTSQIARDVCRDFKGMDDVIDIEVNKRLSGRRTVGARLRLSTMCREG